MPLILLYVSCVPTLVWAFPIVGNLGQMARGFLENSSNYLTKTTVSCFYSCSSLLLAVQILVPQAWILQVCAALRSNTT